MPEILTVRRLSKSFGKVRAVFDISFQVEMREILGIIGPNGAGKTTLFNLVSGEIRPDEGAVEFDGKDVTRVPMYKRCRDGIARTYQIPRPFLNISVLENVMVGMTYGAGFAFRQAKERSEAILEKTGLTSKRKLKAGTLSLLDRKRLELAKALSTCPKLLLVDEVAGGLTESEVEDVLEIIHSVRGEGVTVLWVEHIVMAMQKGPDRLLVMNFGRKLFCGRPGETFSSKEVQGIYLGSEED
jgi:branched-chain amino acid transport system ATP-binding protein